MPKAYPTEAKARYEFLVDQAEKYIARPRTADRSLRQWRKRALDWVRENTTATELTAGLLVTPVSNVQRGLGVLLRARSIVPFLREAPGVKPPLPKNTKKVFIVHGHDNALKNAVARLLSRVGLDPIILHEQPNKGRTIIEKFFDHSDVGFALVLLTPDDRGGSVKEPPENYSLRARQNVILELGFFLGRLGRARVAVIYVDGVDVPSDYKGVLFLPYDDAGSWETPLVKEIREAGIDVDLNRL